MATMIQVPLTFKQETLNAPIIGYLIDGRARNIVMRYFAVLNELNPTVEMVIDHFSQLRAAKGAGRKSNAYLVKLLTELSITEQTDEQLLNNALDFVSMNRGIVK